MSRRRLRNTVAETLTPPDTLTQSQSIARVIKANGKDLYTVQTPESQTLLVELDSKFRATVWIKRGGYVLIDTSNTDDRENKIQGDIINIASDEKMWRKQPYWPPQFVKKAVPVDSDEEESNVGKMPPSDSEEDTT
ncbi:hypothetical protein PV10_04569 [Exophiala mesophila]|uniref:S1-like domain-containing protein n=1 Tax=Exophiala mesophila TaxID=212818 RepID=A0A0D1ZF23_EXOME|nr:uncharacterized protein PV10_04569 [Exophiala mesophila]KIV93352.1 hypothetical protein PV10_04569 [Exophiala mesophila]